MTEYTITLYSGANIARAKQKYEHDLIAVSQGYAAQYLGKPHPADSQPIIAIQVTLQGD